MFLRVQRLGVRHACLLAPGRLWFGLYRYGHEFRGPGWRCQLFGALNIWACHMLSRLWPSGRASIGGPSWRMCGRHGVRLPAPPVHLRGRNDEGTVRMPGQPPRIAASPGSAVSRAATRPSRRCPGGCSDCGRLRKRAAARRTVRCYSVVTEPTRSARSSHMPSSSPNSFLGQPRTRIP